MTKTQKKQALASQVAELERKLFEMKSQQASVLATAFDSIQKSAEFMGSGVILQLTALGGKELIPAVMIRDGLSHKTIAAIQDDLCRSFELATMANPAMARTK